MRTKQAKTGIHWHDHTLGFFLFNRPFNENDVIEIQKEFSTMWYNALKRVYYMDNIEKKKADILVHDVDVRLPSTKDDKNITDREIIEKLYAYITKGFGFELASYRTKQAKNPNRLDFLTFLDLLSKEKNPPRRELHRAKELIIALKGVAKVYFSRGLKTFCGLIEITDEQILKGESGEKVFSCDDKSLAWQTVARTGRKGYLLNYFDEIARTSYYELTEAHSSTGALNILARGINHLGGKQIE